MDKLLITLTYFTFFSFSLSCQKGYRHVMATEVSPCLYIDNYEVTNLQYRWFVKWVKDSLAHEYLEHKNKNESIARKQLDWEYELIWLNLALDDLYYAGDDRVSSKNAFNVDKLVFNYKTNSLDLHRDSDKEPIVDYWKNYINADTLQWNIMQERPVENVKLELEAKTKVIALTGDTIKDWSEFINKYGPQKVRIYPDTLAWVRFDKKYLTYARHYFNHEVFNSYPIVGISHEQAEAFCYWRAKYINYVPEYSRKKSKQLWKCRLPTSQEWKQAAHIKNKMPSSPLGKKDEYKKDLLYHFKSTGEVVQKNKIRPPFVSNFKLTAPVQSYPPNEKGIYHIWGNVAEMISQKGIAKGGSWLDDQSDINLEEEQKYAEPSVWVGFRCICECQQ